MRDLSGVTGEQLYDELCEAARVAGASLKAFARPIFGDSSWKLEQLRIARHPQSRTIERVRALIAGLSPAEQRPRPQAIYDRSMQQMTRVDRERLGLPPSNRSIMEAELAAKAARRRQRVEITRGLVDLAHASRRPGQTIADRVRELRLESQA